MIGTAIVLLVSPGAKCAVLPAAVKSPGAEAEPDAVDHGTSMAAELGFDSEMVNTAWPAASVTVLSSIDTVGVGSSSLIVKIAESPGPPGQLRSAANVSSGSSM